MEEPKPERKRRLQTYPGGALIGPDDLGDTGLKGSAESGVRRAKGGRKRKREKGKISTPQHGGCQVISTKHRGTLGKELDQSDWGTGYAQIHREDLTQWESSGSPGKNTQDSVN